MSGRQPRAGHVGEHEQQRDPNEFGSTSPRMTSSIGRGARFTLATSRSSRPWIVT